MQAEAEVWTTVLFNRFLAGPLDTFLNAVGHPAADPAHPWQNWITVELLVVAIILVVFGLLRSKLSVDKPGAFQLSFEAIYKFVLGQASESIDHHVNRYVPFFGSIFIFILFMNLIGIIPGLESPTMTPAVPLAFAVAVFLYYNWMGFREHGVGKYLLHFAGPVWWMAPIMIPIELISHFARPLSLTIRLYANMFAGERVTITFLTLTYFLLPAVFMGLHVFVALLQAFIFMLLAMIYVNGAVAHEH
jgi:F-type H+-transporting ATPase subunit a